LRPLAAADVDSTNPRTLEVRIDGVRVSILQTRVTSPVFSIFFPQGAVFGLQPGTQRKQSAQSLAPDGERNGGQAARFAFKLSSWRIVRGVTSKALP
jgi:hypothetical protein